MYKFKVFFERHKYGGNGPPTHRPCLGLTMAVVYLLVVVALFVYVVFKEEIPDKNSRLRCLACLKLYND
jgi:hypothetical protein